MHFYLDENRKLNKIKYDQVRDFCLCEKVDEDYMRSLIKRDFSGGGDFIKTGRKKAGRKKVLLYAAVILLLFCYAILSKAE